jgi:hypothetical protein
VIVADRHARRVVDRVHGRKVLELLCYRRDQRRLTFKPLLGAMDAVDPVGDRCAERAALDPQGVRVGKETRALNPTIELLRGQGAEGEEVPVDLVVFVRKLDVVVTEAHESAKATSSPLDINTAGSRIRGRLRWQRTREGTMPPRSGCQGVRMG